jgi:hypothetical protein
MSLEKPYSSAPNTGFRSETPITRDGTALPGQAIVSAESVTCFPFRVQSSRVSVLTQIRPWADSANTYARLILENEAWTDPAKIRLSQQHEGAIKP